MRHTVPPTRADLLPLHSPRVSCAFFFETFAGDLEYRPRRAALYLVLAVAAAAFWFFSPVETKFTATPLVFALGALRLFTKRVFLFRRPSETQTRLALLALTTRNRSPESTALIGDADSA